MRFFPAFLSLLFLSISTSLVAQGNTIITPTQRIVPYGDDQALYIIDFTDNLVSTTSGIGTVILSRSFLVTGGYITGSNLSTPDLNYAVFHTSPTNSEEVKADEILFTVGQSNSASQAFGNLRFTDNKIESVVDFPQPILIENGNLVSIKYQFQTSNNLYRDLRIVLLGKTVTQTTAQGTEGDFFVKTEPEFATLSGPVGTLPPSIVIKHIMPNFALPTTGTTGATATFPQGSTIINSATIVSGPKETPEGIETLVRVVLMTDGLAAGQYNDDVTVVITLNGNANAAIQEAVVPVFMTLNNVVPGTTQAWVIH